MQGSSNATPGVGSPVEFITFQHPAQLRFDTTKQSYNAPLTSQELHILHTSRLHASTYHSVEGMMSSANEEDPFLQVQQ